MQLREVGYYLVCALLFYVVLVPFVSDLDSPCPKRFCILSEFTLHLHLGLS